MKLEECCFNNLNNSEEVMPQNVNPSDHPSLISYEQAFSNVKSDLSIENELYTTNANIDPAFDSIGSSVSGNTYDPSLLTNPLDALNQDTLNAELSTSGQNPVTTTPGGLFDIVSNNTSSTDGSSNVSSQKRLNSIVNNINSA